MDALVPSQTVGMASDASCSAASPRYQPLVVVVVALAVGMMVDRYAESFFGAGARAWLSWLVCWWILSLMGLVAWAIARRRHRDGLAACCLLFGVAATGAAWHDLRWDVFSRVEIARFARPYAEPACVEVIARQRPEPIPAPPPTALRAIPATEQSRLDVTLVAIRDGTKWTAAAGECRLTVDGNLSGVRAGDRLQVFGQLRRLGAPLNPGEFDFAAHARADRRLTTLNSEWPACVTAISVPSAAWSIERSLDAVRTAGKRLLERYVGPERSGLAAAMLLGMREGLPNEATDPYLLTGTVHLLVVSGVNVAILAMGLYGAMRIGWLPRKTALAVIIAVVAAYTLVVETQPPVMRAAVLAILVCLSEWTGRTWSRFNLLAAAAIVVVIINPCDLFQTGAQLSFLCVATLSWAAGSKLTNPRQDQDRLDGLIAASRPWHVRCLVWLRHWIWAMFVVTAAIWFASLPLVLYHFHLATPVALLINVLVWPLATAFMLAGFALLLVGWMVPPLAALLGWICATSLSGLESVVQWAAALPGGHFWSLGPALWWVIGFYAGLSMAMFWGRALAPRRWQLAALCLWIVAGLTPPLAAAWTRDRLEVSFVAMGHGTCVVVETPDGQTLLYDAGSLGSPYYATQSVAAYLWHRGISKIDGIVLSHADVDHYNAVPGLLERFSVGTIYVSPQMFERAEVPIKAQHHSSLNPEPQTLNPPNGPTELLLAIRKSGVPLREIWSGDALRIGPDVVARVFHPPRFGVIGSDNANSVTLAVEYAGQRVLLPGDLESPGLEDVLAELPYDCDVLLAPHHGSRLSDPPGFAAWSTPEWVVISSSGRADAASVVETYEEAGARVLRTGKTGSLRFSIQAGLVAAECHSGSEFNR